ncbi:hypothetical protein [Nostoc sp. ChiVER01]|uniref:hypothetical protein n=1 Tax=Nostoc sp. ChiVER01 TaxID=3075382 RepID=UPI002AD33B75|nr:hypothetical protein [Nostoc sp. ChiVER01]MDZ8228166.1 hypothetical protein [Nostoc sp. ChiVER01]
MGLCYWLPSQTQAVDSALHLECDRTFTWYSINPIAIALQTLATIAKHYGLYYLQIPKSHKNNQWQRMCNGV